MSTLEIDLPRPIRQIVDAVRERGGRPMVVGGAVRDALLGLDTREFDLEVYGLEVDELTRALSAVGKVNAVGRSFGVLKVAARGVEVDVSLPRRESKEGRGHRGFLVAPDPGMTPEEASVRRDFTVNAMAWDPVNGDLLDYHAGRRDLESRVLRHTGPNFADDPLRVLRGMQLAARFELRAAEATIELSRGLFDEYETLARERIWAEWRKWAGRSVRPSMGLEFLAACGWREAYPEVVALEGCPQEPEWHPEGDVWTHTLLVADAAARIAGREGMDEAERVVLVLSALCHDLGKPETTRVEKGRLRSIGHPGCEDTYRAFLLRIGCPSRLADRVVGLSLHHLGHVGFTGSRRHVRRLARNLGTHGETIEMLGRLVEADHSGRPPLPGGLPSDMAHLLEVAGELAAAAAAPRPLLRGRDLLEMGFESGPQMGRVLREAYEAQLDGAFDTVEGARRWVAEETSS